MNKQTTRKISKGYEYSKSVLKWLKSQGYELNEYSFNYKLVKAEKDDLLYGKHPDYWFRTDDKTYRVCFKNGSTSLKKGIAIYLTDETVKLLIDGKGYIYGISGDFYKAFTPEETVHTSSERIITSISITDTIEEKVNSFIKNVQEQFGHIHERINTTKLDIQRVENSQSSLSDQFNFIKQGLNSYKTIIDKVTRMAIITLITFITIISGLFAIPVISKTALTCIDALLLIDLVMFTYLRVVYKKLMKNV